jgi:hypothetical protein
MTVRYEAVNAMLLNEFLKNYRTDQDQGRKLREQELAIARLEALGCTAAEANRSSHCRIAEGE